MTAESLIGPSLLTAGAFLFNWVSLILYSFTLILLGWLIGKCRSRRVRFVRQCPTHGLFEFPRQYKLDLSCCPFCGAETKLLPITRYVRVGD
jgi:hypothetical protein